MEGQGTPQVNALRSMRGVARARADTRKARAHAPRREYTGSTCYM